MRGGRALVLLSGGLDSATCLAIAKEAGYSCFALTISYGQRHLAEIEAARRVAQKIGVEEHKFYDLPLTEFGGSALTDRHIAVPTEMAAGIPVTYV
ncbi:MAG TPA: 7-cyano-7-deazaguanine synthase, partial [Gammaproteobacteria bacterium]|nr:7-cyano-7-deazaguanine synthase [Gammaproteobacteria bacterium]